MYPEWTKVTEKNQTRRPTLPQGAQYDLQLDKVGSNGRSSAADPNLTLGKRRAAFVTCETSEL